MSSSRRQRTRRGALRVLPANDDNYFDSDDDKEEVPKKAEINTNTSKVSSTIAKLVTCSVAGIIFGFACEKGRVFEPSIIRDQMLFTKFLMLKMFLSAVTSSMVVFSLLSMLPPTSKYYAAARREFMATMRSRSILSSIIGGAMLGAGMTLCGACPGMVLSQLGAGVKNAIITLLGCLTGALIYGIVEPAVMKLTKPRRPYKAFMLNQVTPTPFFVLALPIASVLAIVIFVVEHFVPWRTDLTVPNEPNATWISVRAWSPILTGVIVGCLQIPLVLAVKDTMGGSSSYCTVVSQILVTKPLRSLSPYLSKYRTGLANWWQVLYVSGAVFGAWMSANCSDTLGTVDGVSTATSFIGGVVMVFGSRLAAGCTSGHGLSGVGTLSLLSFVTVPAIFAGGMAAAFMLRTLAVI